ncbi:putative sodium-coupled neutral amino acid transporter 8 [Manis javanica]|nr:putative sodium-coupled neutral amino acid transporter 8 [Manis javanica]
MKVFDQRVSKRSSNSVGLKAALGGTGPAPSFETSFLQGQVEIRTLAMGQRREKTFQKRRQELGFGGSLEIPQPHAVEADLSPTSLLKSGKQSQSPTDWESDDGKKDKHTLPGQRNENAGIKNLKLFKLNLDLSTRKELDKTKPRDILQDDWPRPSKTR